jgi:hypothetical protein
MDSLPLFNWRPPEKITIFPSVRNRGRIHRVAASAAATKHPENTIRAALDRLRDSFVRKGLPAAEVTRDLSEYENAIRAHVAYLLARQGRSA